MATTTRSIGPVTLTGADRNGNTANAYIYLQEEYDTDNKQSRVKITRIDLEPYHFVNGYSCSKTDLYKTSTATGSWVKVNGETLFNCTAVNQYGVNLDGTAYSTYGSAVKSWSNSQSDTSTGMFTSSYTSWISYTGSKSITVQGYFTWATSGSYPLDTTGGINTSASVSLYTMPTEPTAWYIGETPDAGTIYPSSVIAGSNFSLTKYKVIRQTMKFAYSGTASFSTEGSYDTKGYLSTSTGFDTSAGAPTSILAQDDDSGSGSNYSFTYNVTAGTTYYLYTRLYSASSSGDISTFIIGPGAPCTLTLSKGDYISSVSGGGTYNNGSTVSASATVNSTTAQYSYSFAGWYEYKASSAGDATIITPTLVSLSNPYSFQISSDITLTAEANRTLRSYTITPSAGTYVSSVSGGGTYTYGTSVTLKATLPSTTAQYSYSFDGWYNSSGTKVSSSATYTFTVSGAVSLTAKGTRTLRNYDLAVILDSNSAAIVSVNGTAYTVDSTGTTTYTGNVPYGATIDVETFFVDGYWPKSYSISGVSGTSSTGAVTVSIESVESPWYKDGSNVIYIPYVYAASASTRAGEPSGGSEDDSSESWKPYVGYIGSTNTSTGEFYIGQVKT